MHCVLGDKLHQCLEGLESFADWAEWLISWCVYLCWLRDKSSERLKPFNDDDDDSFLADEDFGKVDGQFLLAHRWLFSLILDVQTLLHFGQAKVWAGNDWDAAHFFSLLRLFFVASCLSASNLWLAFLTDERQLSQSETSCCYDWWLIPTCASCLFSWSL